MRLLLIDDDPDFLFLMGAYLRKQGFDVDTAIDGMSAMDEMYLHPADVIISDVFMNGTPIMSLTLTLKHDYPHTPLILVSGVPTGALVKNVMALGADAFFPKPVDVKSLVDKIHTFQANA